MKTAYLLILLAFSALSLLAGCASPSQNASGPGEKTSDIPWNKPQGWEGGGQLGSALGQ